MQITSNEEHTHQEVMFRKVQNSQIKEYSDSPEASGQRFLKTKEQ